MEQEEYTKEEINWSYVEFVDNQDVLDLIEKVTYQADQFLDKNKDYIVAEYQALLDASKCTFVSNLFPPLPEETSKQSKFSSIGTRFKQQLQALMETLNTTEPHYIRCVKPNAVLKPGIFENFNVLNQLRCGGVLEAIRISCAGYPTKRTFDEFLDRFGMLAPDVLDGSDEKSACISICDRMGLKSYQIGKTKVFLRAGQMAELDARRTEVLANAARRIQRQIQTYLARKEFITLRGATIHMQKFWRAQLARKLYEYLRKEAASIRVQKHLRAHAARKSYTNLHASAITIQSGMQAMTARNEYRHRRRNKAAIIVQTQWRRYHALSAYKQQKKATLTLQCLWRSRVARKELRKLKMDARETGALKEAKDKLEKRVEELKWRLDFEKHMRIDLEEAKGQEIAKLQSTLHDMQRQLDEAHAATIREKEAAKIAIEQAPPVIKEVPVVDNSKVEELTLQNEELESVIREINKRVEEFEQKYTEVENESKVRLKEAEDSQLKVSELQETIERLELNLSNLESENQVLRQQALVASIHEDLSEEMKITNNKIKDLESENELLRSQKVVEQITSHEQVQLQSKESDPLVPLLTKQRSLTSRQQENHDVLIKCLVEDKGFDRSIPVAACIVYRVLLQWRSFEAEKTNIFDRIIHTIRSSIEVALKYKNVLGTWQLYYDPLMTGYCNYGYINSNLFEQKTDLSHYLLQSHDNFKDMAYWLSTTSTLLFLLQNTIKASNTPNGALHRNRTSPVTLFGRMAHVSSSN
ncbi:hypothetical protein U1Q18_043179 [Sarracenia purpurea var. burkii]